VTRRTRDESPDGIHEEDGGTAGVAPPASSRGATPVSRAELFRMFLRAGWAFGGGLGILAVYEDEFVTKRRLVTREEFLTLYGIARLVPTGPMTALAVAYGHRFGGLLGTVIALAALVLPAFVLTVGLTIAYDHLRQTRVLELLEVTVMPAALALILVAAIKLGQDVFRPSRELLLAGAAFALTLFAGVNPAVVLIAGGVIGALAFDRPAAGGIDRQEGAE
jgi:chromate transporter